MPYSRLASAGCFPLLQLSTVTLAKLPNTRKQVHHLYLSSPLGLNACEIFQYHLTTRNFFAVILDVPLVGVDPVSAILEVKKRMEVWRDYDLDNTKTIFDYIHRQGYADSPKANTNSELKTRSKTQTRRLQQLSAYKKPLPLSPDEEKHGELEQRSDPRSRRHSTADCASTDTPPTIVPSLDHNCDSPVSPGSPKSLIEEVPERSLLSPLDKAHSEVLFAADSAREVDTFDGSIPLPRDEDMMPSWRENNSIYSLPNCPAQSSVQPNVPYSHAGIAIDELPPEFDHGPGMDPNPIDWFLGELERAGQSDARLRREPASPALSLGIPASSLGWD